MGKAFLKRFVALDRLRNRISETIIHYCSFFIFTAHFSRFSGIKIFWWKKLRKILRFRTQTRDNRSIRFWNLLNDSQLYKKTMGRNGQLRVSTWWVVQNGSIACVLILLGVEPADGRAIKAAFVVWYRKLSSVGNFWPQKSCPRGFFKLFWTHGPLTDLGASSEMTCTGFGQFLGSISCCFFQNDDVFWFSKQKPFQQKKPNWKNSSEPGERVAQRQLIRKTNYPKQLPLVRP